MPDIYRQAKRVVVWPGPIQWRTANLSVEEAERAGLQVSDMHDGWNAARAGSDEQCKTYRLCTTRLFHNELRRRYFERLWIVQELLLSRDRYIILDGILERWNNIAQQLIDVWEKWAKWTTDDQLRQQYPGLSVVTVRRPHRPGVLEIVKRPRIVNMLLQSLQENRAILPFRDLVQTSSESKCSEPRDHLYGLLSLAENGPAFPVDYSQPKEHVLFDALEYFIPITGIDFEGDFLHPWEQLNGLFETETGALCRPCVLDGRFDRPDDDKEHDAVRLNFSEATVLPVQFMLAPVRQVGYYFFEDRQAYNGIGMCQSCRRGIFDFSGPRRRPPVDILFSRNSPTRLWVTVSNASIPKRIQAEMREVRDKVRGAIKKARYGKGNDNRIHVGNDTPETARALFGDHATTEDPVVPLRY